MKLQIMPPARAKTVGKWSSVAEGHRLCNAWDVVAEVAPTHRRRRALATHVQQELLRQCALLDTPVRVGMAGKRAPFFYFERVVVDAWLELGRAWIIAELEARSGKYVIAFKPEPRR